MATPVRPRVYLAVVAVAALTLPIVLRPYGVHVTEHPALLTVGVLVLISVLNVEIGRALAGGLQHSQQPHKALSAWAFASALLLPPTWLLLIVPLTYAHARWRGLRVPLWKWVWSALYLILCGVTAGVVAHTIFGHRDNWMAGNGGWGLVAVAASAATFLVAEGLLFAGSALLNHADDEVWLRQMLRSPDFYATECGVLLIGGLLSVVWTGGGWFVLLFVPISTLAQRAALHGPLRERAATAALLAEKNVELERANQFKIDLMGMLGHELGNPLTSVVGYSQEGLDALDRGDIDTARRGLGVVTRNADQIRRVLHDILAMVSSGHGALVANPEPCRVEGHLHAAVASRPGSDRPVVQCEPDVTAVVQPGHLDQMLANLLINAEKYAGGATRVSACAEGDRVRVSVVDAGPGVPAAFREHLFQRFRRDAGTAPTVMGTGLGLFITRELARANGGDVLHGDVEPSGSEFVLTLPRAN